MDEVRFREALLNIVLMIRGALSTGNVADPEVQIHLVDMMFQEITTAGAEETQ